MTTEELKQLHTAAVSEIKELKLVATPDELAKLNIDDLHPWDADACIYGLMTGHCHSARACNLIRRCAMPFSFRDVYSGIPEPALPRMNRANYSALEYLITYKPQHNPHIIAYLRGEVDTLNLPELN